MEGLLVLVVLREGESMLDLSYRRFVVPLFYLLDA